MFATSEIFYSDPTAAHRGRLQAGDALMKCKGGAANALEYFLTHLYTVSSPVNVPNI